MTQPSSVFGRMKAPVSLLMIASLFAFLPGAVRAAVGTTTADTDNGGALGTSTEAVSVDVAAPATANICGDHIPYLSTYLRMGAANDPIEVKKLQTFLNMYLDLDIPVTGAFGPLTLAAVNSFQLKNSQEVLQPWVAYGLPNDQTPTGYVYKTTQRMINQLACGMDIPMPILP